MMMKEMKRTKMSLFGGWSHQHRNNNGNNNTIKIISSCCIIIIIMVTTYIPSLQQVIKTTTDRKLYDDDVNTTSLLLLLSTTTKSDVANNNTSRRTFNFEAHRDILVYATQPGRGHKHNPDRIQAWLPEVQGSYWWLNETVPESFTMAELDRTYSSEYFDRGHPTFISDNYTSYVLKMTSLFMPQRNPVTSLAEFGNGGGYFSKLFSTKLQQYGPDAFMTIEGTGAGVAETLNKWKLPPNQVVQHDLRHPLFLGKRYDVAVCTEVVEHVEPPFSSQIVLTLIMHADVIWFSHKPLGLVNRAWINHPNERPLKLWKILFDFYGYDIVLIPPKVEAAVAWRGTFIAYRRANTTLSSVTTADMNAAAFPEHQDPSIK